MSRRLLPQTIARYHAGVALKSRKPDGKRVGRFSCQYERKEEFVPAQDKGQQAGGKQAWRRYRDGNKHERLESRSAVDTCRLFELLDFPMKERNEHPGEKRNVDCEMRDDDAAPAIEQMYREEERI